MIKVLVKENEVPTEKNSSRASIFATKVLKIFALELGGIEFTSEAPALSRCEIFTSFYCI